MDLYGMLIASVPVIILVDMGLHLYIFYRTRWLFRTLTGADEDSMQEIADVLGPALASGVISAPKTIARSIMRAVKEGKEEESTEAQSPS